jgi:predicted transcriptional regulator
MPGQLVEVEVSSEDVAEVRRKTRALRPRITGKRADAKIEVDAGTLRVMLKVVDAVLPHSARQEAVAGRRKEAPSLTAEEISPQEAADILGMSRPSVMRLIEKGDLHPRKVLSRNKLSRTEVVAYRDRLSKHQRRALNNLAALSEEYDF